MMDTATELAGRSGTWRPDRPQQLLAAVMIPVLLIEFLVAWKTHGTYDINIWHSFADTVRQVGPIQIYSLDHAGLMVYNHPPLVGWWLMVVNFFESIGIERGTTIRAATAVAHAITAFLILAILRRRVPIRWAILSAVIVACSPVLVIISGFHGNNDPVVAMLTIASVYLLVDRRMPLLAGVAFSLAISVKIIPVMALPLLLVAAWGLDRQDPPEPVRSRSSSLGSQTPRRSLYRFMLGGLPVFVLFWLPVLFSVRAGFIDHVLLYNGSGFPRQWGLYQLGRYLHVSDAVLGWYAGTGTYVVLALCAFLPAWFIRRTPLRAPAALGLCLSMFLFLTPGWATQYSAYVAGAVFLIEFWSAMIFTVGAGAVYLTLYYQWRGDVQELKPYQIPILMVAWLSLIAPIVAGLRLFLRQMVSEQPQPEPVRAAAPE